MDTSSLFLFFSVVQSWLRGEAQRGESMSSKKSKKRQNRNKKVQHDIAEKDIEPSRSGCGITQGERRSGEGESVEHRGCARRIHRASCDANTNHNTKQAKEQARDMSDRVTQSAQSGATQSEAERLQRERKKDIVVRAAKFLLASTCPRSISVIRQLDLEEQERCFTAMHAIITKTGMLAKDLAIEEGVCTREQLARWQRRSGASDEDVGEAFVAKYADAEIIAVRGCPLDRFLTLARAEANIEIRISCVHQKGEDADASPNVVNT
jgi:hypothetical protein